MTLDQVIEKFFVDIEEPTTTVSIEEPTDGLSTEDTTVLDENV